MSNLVKKIKEVQAEMRAAKNYSCAEKLNDVLKEAKEDEWIPVSERLPSKEEYIKCNGQFIVSDGNRTYATYFDIYDTLRFGEPTIDYFRIDRRVIAWRLLPEPYRGEEA